jgi:hypothetical protein
MANLDRNSSTETTLVAEAEDEMITAIVTGAAAVGLRRRGIKPADRQVVSNKF